MDGDQVRAELIKRLKNRWSENCSEVRPGVSLKQIEHFEFRHNVRMPLDLREYFATVDGHEEVFDVGIFSFLPLESVRSLPEVLGENGQISVHHRIMGALFEP
jgi:hypothetical protein